MKILFRQPKLEMGIEQLESEILKNPFVVAAIFPEGYLMNKLMKKSHRVND
jgi:hypothetical protein